MLPVAGLWGDGEGGGSVSGTALTVPCGALITDKPGSGQGQELCRDKVLAWAQGWGGCPEWGRTQGKKLMAGLGLPWAETGQWVAVSSPMAQEDVLGKRKFVGQRRGWRTGRTMDRCYSVRGAGI